MGSLGYVLLSNAERRTEEATKNPLNIESEKNMPYETGKEGRPYVAIVQAQSRDAFFDETEKAIALFYRETKRIPTILLTSIDGMKLLNHLENQRDDRRDKYALSPHLIIHKFLDLDVVPLPAYGPCYVVGDTFSTFELLRRGVQ